MKNPLPTPAIIAVIAAALIVVAFFGYKAIQGSGPIELPAKPPASGNRFKTLQSASTSPPGKPAAGSTGAPETKPN
jgi:hypothetical protein